MGLAGGDGTIVPCFAQTLPILLYEINDENWNIRCLLGAHRITMSRCVPTATANDDMTTWVGIEAAYDHRKMSCV